MTIKPRKIKPRVTVDVNAALPLIAAGLRILSTLVTRRKTAQVLNAAATVVDVVSNQGALK